MKQKEENLEDKIYNYPTKYKEGFIKGEIEKLLEEYPQVKDKMYRFNRAMMGNTCMVRNDEIISYHCDVLTALRCALEDRGLKTYEFD